LIIKHRYYELEGENSSIDKAFQEIRFLLNKKGAEVKSEARIIFKDGGHERSFIFDKSFLIYLKEKKGKYPYLAIWIDNCELLVNKIDKDKKKK